MFLPATNLTHCHASSVYVVFIALALMMAATVTHAFEETRELDFESQTPGSTNVPALWSYIDSGLGGSGSYSNTTAGGGSGGAGIGGALASPNPTHGDKIPYSYLVNSGYKYGFFVTEPIYGSYEFKLISEGNAYDKCAFIFGDIQNGSLSGSDPGELLLIFTSNGGFSQPENKAHIRNGADLSLTNNGTAGGTFNDFSWYKISFNWTPINGSKTGDIYVVSESWTGSDWAAHSTFSASGHVFNTKQAYIGIGDGSAPETIFDNVSVTGTIPPPGTVIAIH